MKYLAAALPLVAVCLMLVGLAFAHVDNGFLGILSVIGICCAFGLGVLIVTEGR